MASKKLTPAELVESHKPKNFKFKYIFSDPTLITELTDCDYDMFSLDTINDDELVMAALKSHFNSYERTIVGKAKEPSRIDDSIIVSKKMVTKADKKLLALFIGSFEYKGTDYVAIRLHYERFDILEIFIMI